jgi:hypothetical protein
LVRFRVVDKHFNQEKVDLNLIQRLKLRLFGFVYLFKAAKEGWRTEVRGNE